MENINYEVLSGLLIVLFQTKHTPSNLSVTNPVKWLDKARNIYGPDDPSLVPFLLNVAQAFLLYGTTYQTVGPVPSYGPTNCNNALPHLEKAYEIRKRSSPPDSLEMAEVMAPLGTCLAFMGKHDRADFYLKKSLEIRESKLGNDNPLVGRVLLGMAMNQILQSQPGAQPVIVKTMLSVNPLPVHMLPPASREYASRSLAIYNDLQKQKYGQETWYKQDNAFSFDAQETAFKLYEDEGSDLMDNIKAIKEAEGGPQGGGCFVATAVYGDYDCPQVMALRKFRDERLLPDPLGRAVVFLYYTVGPYLAMVVGKLPWLSKALRHLLNAVIRKIK
ncbi:tetratricopeptide repeat protein [candidate division TA06 bacterium]|nr:tetratricopeptide repeat protein [candidate division TA06 bacterium]